MPSLLRPLAAAAVALLLHAGSAAAVQILYTFEGDVGTGITDRLTDDGAQNPTVLGGASVDPTPGNAGFGSSSLAFPTSPASPTLIQLPGTQSLGTRFTLAVLAQEVAGDHSRLFSAYYGASVTPAEMLFDLNQGASNVVTVSIQGSTIQRTGTFDDGAYHHFALTFDAGVVRIYQDGVQLGADAFVSPAPVNLIQDLQFGEDLPPTSQLDQPFEGFADDILVLDRALAPGEVALLAANGAAWFVPEPGTAILLGLGLLGLVRVGRPRRPVASGASRPPPAPGPQRFSVQLPAVLEPRRRLSTPRFRVSSRRSHRSPVTATVARRTHCNSDRLPRGARVARND